MSRPLLMTRGMSGMFILAILVLSMFNVDTEKWLPRLRWFLVIVSTIILWFSYSLGLTIGYTIENFNLPSLDQSAGVSSQQARDETWHWGFYLSWGALIVWGVFWVWDWIAFLRYGRTDDSSGGGH